MSEAKLKEQDRHTVPLDASRGDSLLAALLDMRRLIVPIGAGLLLWGLIFHAEVANAVRTWDVSTAYNHCFLVIPIVLYLLWDRRRDLVGQAARPGWKALPLCLPLIAAWLVAERLGIMEGRQLIAVSFAQVLIFSILGPALWKRACGPLLYLYFLVPFGEFLTPRLQDITTAFVRYGLIVLNIPAYIDGYVIEIPEGTFLIAEACAGLRFLIASIAFGCLYAILMYRSPVRRTVFILASIAVPVVANGFRGLGIVWLGHVLGSAQAAATDHVLYGWIFFSIVILILIAVGLPFRQDDQPYRRAGSGDPPQSRTAGEAAFPMQGMAAVVLAVLVAAGIGPLVAGGLSRAAAATPEVVQAIDPGPGCSSVLRPADPAHSALRTQRVTCGGAVMDLAWEPFAPRITAAALMAERRRLCLGAETESLQQDWLQTEDGHPSTWRIMRSNEPVFATAVSLWIEGRPVRPGMRMRLAMAKDSILGASHAPVVMTVTPVVDWPSLSREERRSVEEGLSAFLRGHADLADKVAAVSALR